MLNVELKKFILPLSIVGDIDVTRLLREINALNDFFVTVEARKSDSSTQPPRITRLLNDVALANKYNLLQKGNRAELADRLNELKKTAPSIHISFAAEPSPKALEQVLRWLRENVHSLILLRIGLQPSIAAGCVLRTANKVFDFSLRENLNKQEPYLVKLIRGASHEQ
jgi:F0F1-type ATP synthase delta subunit